MKKWECSSQRRCALWLARPRTADTCLCYKDTPACATAAFLQAFELLFTFKQESTDHGGKFVNNEFDDIYLVRRELLL